MRVHTLLVALCAAGVAAVTVTAQSSDAFKFRSGVELINVTATVTDDTGRFVSGLRKEDFTVYENGVRQDVSHFSNERVPVSLGILLDASGSMTRSAEIVRQTAREFVSSVRPEDSLSLITFADQPFVEHAMSVNRQLTLDAIDKYKPIGGTALYDALWDGLQQVKRVAGRRAIVVLTDGRDENNPGTGPGSEHTFNEVQELVRSVDAVIFPIGLGPRVDRDVLEKLATQSGGQAYFPADVSELDDQYRNVIENLRRRYVLSYTSSNSTHDGTWRTVEIRSRVDGLRIATRGGYFAPAE